MRYILLIIINISLLVSCSNIDNAHEENQYHLYSFWSTFPYENWEETEADEEIKREFETYSSLEIPEGKLHSVEYFFPDSSKFEQYDNTLGIDEFPTFIVLDSAGEIRLITTDASEMEEFVISLPDIKDEEG
jgi:hypothetical protein